LQQAFGYANGIVVAHSVETRALRIAAAMLGGPRKLRDFLQVPSAEIAAWLAGIRPPPKDVSLRVVDLILDDLDRGGKRLAAALSRRKRHAAEAD
jgi:hypothetical protein